MSTISHGPSGAIPETRSWPLRVLVPEMWPSLAIVVIWVAVLFDAVLGPDLVTESAGGDTVIVPSAVVLGLFALFATWTLAKYGFGGRKAPE